ncbi:SUKH-4 family immunity protein [Kitasatospora purpeofusca]|uniref:SUKH-4 family immunity protein n=1 Tax=Kitasatospora purpeofusca TaxID=67352 RepID=UPI003F4D4A85
MRRFSPDELPERRVHGPTRRLLSDVGLPLSDRCALTVAAGGSLTTMAQRYPGDYAPDRDGESTAHPHQGEYVALGGWMYDLDVVLDCATGRISCPTGTATIGPRPTSTATSPHCSTSCGPSSGCERSVGAGTVRAPRRRGRSSGPVISSTASARPSSAPSIHRRGPLSSISGRCAATMATWVLCSSR